MLAPVLAAIVQFYSPALPNSGYVDVLVPTNPIPYASRLKGEVFGNGELLPRVEDMIFTYQLAFERMIVKQMGTSTLPYLEPPIDAEPSRLVAIDQGRNDIVFYGYRGSQVSSGGSDGTFTPTTLVPADMIGYAMTDADASFFAISDSPSAQSLIPSGPFLLAEDYSGTGTDYVLDCLSEACFDPSLYLQLTNSVVGLAYQRNDLYTLCELGDLVKKYCFDAGTTHVTNSVEDSVQDFSLRWWTSGTGPDSGWHTTNWTVTVARTNDMGTLQYISEANKRKDVYWSADQYGEADQKQGVGYEENLHESTERPNDYVYLTLCGDKAYYWDYQREGTSSRVRQKSMTAYAVFYAIGQASGRTSVNASLDTTLVDEDLECWIVCPLGTGAPTPIPRIEVGDGYTNRWCEIMYSFPTPDLAGPATSVCQFFGWASLPGQSFPDPPVPSSWKPNGSAGYVARSYLDYVVNMELEGIVGIVEYDFVATLKVQQGGESQEGANDNP